MEIKQNIDSIMKDLPKGVVLCAASKTRTAKEIDKAIDAGIKIIGMNYLQEAIDVKKEVLQKATWSFIGHMQSNKVKKIVELFERIETIDRKKTLELVSKEAKKINKTMQVLLEINIGHEENKQGLHLEEVEAFANEAIFLDNIELIGLMTMGSSTNETIVRGEFRRVKQCFDNLKKNLPREKQETFSYLSMGMSDTYKIAIEEGSNYIRLGTAIYGKRRSS